MTLMTGVMQSSENAALHHINIILNILYSILKQKTIIFNCNNTSQYYCVLFCIFYQMNAGLISIIRDFFKKNFKNSNVDQYQNF